MEDCAAAGVDESLPLVAAGRILQLVVVAASGVAVGLVIAGLVV